MSRPILKLKIARAKPVKQPAVTPARMKNFKQAKHLTTWLEREFPEVFSRKNPRPLMLGAHKVIADLTATRPATVRVALHYWCSRNGYRRAIAKGGPRYTLSLAVSGAVTPEEQEQAVAALNPKTEKPSGSEEVGNATE